MAELADRLRSALAGRYDIGRELGRGGMATVYLAEDLKHHRSVAIKVFRPEVAAALGSDRFLREIEVAAQLNDPHILPLFDSGDADGLLYYVMPYVEGESLRDRLTREGQLPIEDAIAITCQVADALAYAHSKGVVHRDIKPENIMLSGEHALVADFGIARAMDTAGGTSLTETGIAVGTPAYMSPEQAAAEAHLDARSDTYSLGCVLFELLAGEPPFTGPSSQAIQARHALEAVPSLRIIRRTVPEHVEAAVRRALEKVPADRFATASAFAEALRGGQVGVTPRRAPSPDAKIRRAVAATGVVGVTALVVVLAIGGVFGGSGPEAAVDPRLIAVLPFRVSGTIDTSLVTAEELVDHMHSRLPGEGGPRALEPGLVLPAWQEAAGSPHRSLARARALRLASSLGAGHLLEGRIHGAPNQLSLDASVFEVPGGRELARVEAVSGIPDSPLALLDRLTAELLVRLAGEERRLPDLATKKLPALRAYLAGRELYGAGRYVEAIEAQEHALAVDSSFALAGLAHETAEEHAGRFSGRGMRVAWANRDQLNPADSTYLRARRGPRHPEPSGYVDRLVRWQWLVETAPDHWDGAYQLGVMLYEMGPLVGREAPHQRAQRALRDALRSRPTFVPAMEALLDLAGSTRDLEEVRRISTVLLSADTVGDNADFVRWHAGTLLGDSTLLAGVRERFAELPSTVLERIMGVAQLDGVGLDDAVQAAAARRSQARSQFELWWASLLSRALALNQGRPTEARRIMAEEPLTVPANELSLVVEALYWDGDSAAAAEAVAHSVTTLAAPPGTRSDAARAMDRCTISLWRLGHGITRGMEETIRVLRTDETSRSRAETFMPVCAAILEAEASALLGRPSAATALEFLDSLMQRGPETNAHLTFAANLTVARLREAGGDLVGALAAARRRSYHHTFGVTGLATILREEGRLAALAGDREGAIRAYRHYVALRADAEPALQEDVARVRAELSRLVGEPASQIAK